MGTTEGEPGSGPRAEQRVGFLGPAGTFTEEALLSSTLPGTIAPVSLASIYETVMALRRREVDWAIVPIENSLDGSVTVTLDLLADPDGALEIVGEVLLPIRHALIASEPLALGDIQTVLSHPQVPGQCTRFLREELAGARVLPASSTAEAVRLTVQEASPGQAAIGTLLAGEMYGGTVLREDVQDRDDNETRFVWLARKDEDRGAPPLRTPSSPADWKTALVFWGAGAEHPGWLVGCLNEFARRALNLTRIESRPQRASMGHYVFFVDLQGALENPSVAGAVDGLRRHCHEVLVLGSYPAA
jgi:prephenate dehydratase